MQVAVLVTKTPSLSDVIKEIPDTIQLKQSALINLLYPSRQSFPKRKEQKKREKNIYLYIEKVEPFPSARESSTDRECSFSFRDYEKKSREERHN